MCRLLVVIESSRRSCRRRAGRLAEHLVAVDQELDRAGVVLDLVAVCVVDGAPVDETVTSTRSRSSGSPYPSRSAAAAAAALWSC